jgi:hypothetical protein
MDNKIPKTERSEGEQSMKTERSVKRKGNELLHLVPGFCQGLIRVFVSYPFDIVKVHMQTHPVTMIDCLRDFWKNDKFKFYRGSSISFCVVPVDRSLQYFMYERLNKHVNPFVSGWIVGTVSGIYNVPVQSIISNLALTKDKPKLQMFVNTFVKENGVKHMYKGTRVEILRLAAFTSLYLGIYGYLRRRDENMPFMNGVITSISSWLIMFPIDTMRTRVQTSEQTYKTISYQNMYRGLLPVLLRTVPSAGLGMYVYEHTRKYLQLE